MFEDAMIDDLVMCLLPHGPCNPWDQGRQAIERHNQAIEKLKQNAGDKMTSEAQRKAQSRYDEKRPAPVSVRMNAEQLAQLDALRQQGEGRGPALLRLAGLKSG